MNLVYKTGTNQLHGSFDGRIINQDLIHRDYFTQAPFTNPFWYRMLDGAISGPVRFPKLYNGTNRTFFLFAYGGHFQKGKAGTSVATVPTSAMRNGDFSFGGQGSADLQPVHDAAGRHREMDSRSISGNMIPTSLFDPVVKNFLATKPVGPSRTTPACMTRTGRR